MPVNADFEGGFATDPGGIAANVKLAVAAGVAGLSIEDSTGNASQPLYDFSLAVDRIRAARRAIDGTGTGVRQPHAQRVSSSGVRICQRRFAG